MKTYLLGAGCSRNYAEGVTKIQGLLPPLDKDFFRMAKKVMPAVPIPQSIMKFVPYIGTRPFTRGIVEFQLPPEEITESRSNRYSAAEIFGRFEPVKVYTGGEPTQINMTMKYYWLEDSFVESIGTWEGIHKNIKKLKAFTYPLYSARNLIDDIRNTFAELVK